MDSQFHYHFQNNSSSFQQDNEPINYEKMLEAMTHAQNARNRDIDMMVESLHSHRLTSSDVTYILLEPKSHVVLEIKILFQNNHVNLPKLHMILIVWLVFLSLK